jgi:DNA-binding CsgD family transcriptional regulator
METFDLLWTASIEEIKKGYIQKGDCFACLLCEKEFEKGIIYPEEGVFYEAERYMRFHIEKAHHSVFDTLIQMDKDLTGLSDHQKKLLQLFYQGKSDNEIRKEMEIGSASTIRNHRFVLKKKERLPT